MNPRQDIQDKVAFILAVFFLLLSLAIWTVPALAARLERHVLCKDVSTFSPYDPIGVATRFSTAEAQIYSWVRLNDVRGPYTVRWLFVNPRQQDWTWCEFRIPSGSWDWYAAWCRMPLDAGAEGFLTGEWRVFVFLDCRPLTQARFTLAAAWTDEREPNNTSAAAQRIASPGQVRGFASTGDEDWYVVTLSGNGRWFLSVSTWWSRPQAMAMVFRGASLQDTVATHYVRRDSEGLIWNECFALTAPGTYYVKIRGGTLTPDEYMLSIRRDEPWWVGK